MEPAPLPMGSPDWVILGTPWGDGKVAVIASTELNEAELRMMRPEWEELTPGRLLHKRREDDDHTVLHVVMERWTLIVADSYELALRALFMRWSPQPSEPARLPPGRASEASD